MNQDETNKFGFYMAVSAAVVTAVTFVILDRPDRRQHPAEPVVSPVAENDLELSFGTGLISSH